MTCNYSDSDSAALLILANVVKAMDHIPSRLELVHVAFSARL